MEPRHPVTPHAAPHPQIKPAPVAIRKTPAFPTGSVLTLIWISTGVAAQIKHGKAKVVRSGAKMVTSDILRCRSLH